MSDKVSDEQIAKWRKLKSHGMVSAVGEYTPDEFWLALDEIERLRAPRAPAITEGDSPRTDALRAKHKSGVGNSFYGEMHQHAETLERELSLRAPASGDALSLALKFHEIYERLAPSFGYETRQDTRAFDPESKNGKLMVAVCGEILAAVGVLMPRDPNEAMRNVLVARNDHNTYQVWDALVEAAKEET
jgi:hypothetical protein